jgi:hypothetical protein
MNTKNISLALLAAVGLSLCACDSKVGKGATEVNNTLSAPEHKNTSTEPGGKGTTTEPPASSK